jgi:hypothetical protein
MAKSKRVVKSGDLGRDVMTGFTGHVVARTTWLHGCARLGLEPAELGKDGNIKEPEAEPPTCWRCAYFDFRGQLTHDRGERGVRKGSWGVCGNQETRAEVVESDDSCPRFEARPAP